MAVGGRIDEVEVHDVEPMGPHALNIVNVVEEEDHSFELNEEALKRLLLDPRVADKKVAVIGVAGAYRKGKSFLLNFFLRYLTWRSSTPDADDTNMDWLTSHSALEGFSWRGGSERDTSGILLWSKPFIIKDRNGEEIVVLLMDTQGAFDSQSTVKDNATIFALSTMITSVQIYNLFHNIQEDDLQHLQLFTDYGRLVLDEGSDVKPFQSLLFLVRDWAFPYEAEYGFQGGLRTLDKRLQLSDKQHPELQTLRKHIRSCFEDINCFLMPHPGLKVATNPNFQGHIADVEAEFQQQLRVLVPRLLDSSHLATKSINGRPITCRDLVHYFVAYLKVFQSKDLPEPKSMLTATAEANNLAAVSNALALYQRCMEEVCGGDSPYLSTQLFDEHHDKCKRDAIRDFRNARKMGGTEFSLQFLEDLEKRIEEQHESYLKMNQAKNLFKSMRTPAVLVVILIIDYILREFFEMIGLGATIFTGILQSAMMIILGCLTVWVYSRYSGNLRDVGAKIDEGVSFVWTNFISPNAGSFGALGGVIQAEEAFAAMNNSTQRVNNVRKRQ